MTRLIELHLENVRCHPTLAVAPDNSDWVVLAGANGSGKTSVLEGIYCAARGRSFRSTSLAEAIRIGTSNARVLLRTRNESNHVLGMELRTRQRTVHLDGMAADQAAIARAVPVEYLGGDTIQLVQGPPAARRRFMDWALFHVEPQFLTVWRFWYRAHRQRNALLKVHAPSVALAPWTAAVIAHGEVVSRLRAHFVERMDSRLSTIERPSILRGMRLRFCRGWREATLREALQQSKGREAQMGRTVVGPQQDNWILVGDAGGVSGLSRGQAKLASLILYRCRAGLMQAAERHPVLLMDDIAADLDPVTMRTALDLWVGAGLQIWLSVLEENIGLELPGKTARFHVKQGALLAVA